MSIDIGWVNIEETVIAFSFRSNWSAQDFYLAIDELCQTVDEKLYPVQMIIDLSYSINSPENLLTLFRAAMKKMPSHIEQAVIISKSNYWHRIFLMLDGADLVPFPFQHVYNADDAYELLEEYVL